MELNFTVEKEEDIYVCRLTDTSLATHGDTPAEAVSEMCDLLRAIEMGGGLSQILEARN